MKVVTFEASFMHEWSSVLVQLDEPDQHFANSWQCQVDPAFRATQPQFLTSDYKTWRISNLAYKPVLQ